MSETPHEPLSDHEQYAHKMTRRIFWYTVLGSIAFSAVMVVLWYVF